MSPVDVLVVIPTFNEAANIRGILDAVLDADPGLHVLVVDDGSPDGTGAIVRAHPSERVHLLANPAKRGLGPAYVSGFRWGLARGFSRFVEMDADFSHDPAVVPRLVAATQGSGVAIGSRYIPGGGVEGWSRGRLILSRAGNLYARAALGLPVHDSTSGFRCYRREVLEAIGLETVRSEGYAFQIDLTYRAWRLGFEIRELPIVFRERSEGRSKMSRAIVVEAIAAVTVWGIRDRATRAGRRGAVSSRASLGTSNPRPRKEGEIMSEREKPGDAAGAMGRPPGHPTNLEEALGEVIDPGAGRTSVEADESGARADTRSRVDPELSREEEA